jgi:hypothetical protein
MPSEADKPRSILPPPDPPFRGNVLALLSAERPGLVSGTKASYRPGTVRIPEDAVINIKNRSFTFTAELEITDGNAEGILVTLGGETGGYALVVQDAKPAFHYNWLGRERYTITSAEPLPNGPCTIRFDVGADWGTPISPTYQPPFEFNGTLKPGHDRSQVTPRSRCGGR